MRRTGCALLAGVWLATAGMSLAATPAKKTSKETTKQTISPATTQAERPAAAAVLIADRDSGRRKFEAEPCQECHGPNAVGLEHGNGGSEGKFPRLAGQQAGYLSKQLQDFRSGARKDEMMQMIAAGLGDQDIADITAYLASLPPVAGSGEASVDAATGGRLFKDGDAPRALPACQACHGTAGQGGTAAAPRLAGQSWRYLEKQLLDWRSGFRRNSSDGEMSRIARLLGDADIKALADYLSSQ